MPLIKASSKHAKMLEVPPEGRYNLVLKKVLYTDNKAKDGKNYVYTFEISEGDFQGKPFDVYTSATKDFGIAQSLQIYKAITKDTEESPEWEPETLVDGLCVGELIHEPWQGRLIPKLSGIFYPAGTATEVTW